MRYVIAFLLGAFLASLVFPARAGDPWDSADTTIGVVTALFIIRDWGQTRYVAMHPEKYVEQNKILGEHPSVGKVDRYFVGYLVVGYFIADWFSPHYRKAFLLTISMVELNATQHNKHIGVKVAF